MAIRSTSLGLADFGALTLTMVLPTGTAVGDWLIAVINTWGTETVTPPAGWTIRGTQQTSTLINGLDVVTYEIKSYVGTEGLVWTVAGNSPIVAYAIALTGRDTGSNSAFQYTVPAVTPTQTYTLGISGVNATAGADLIVIPFGSAELSTDVIAFSTPSGYTGRDVTAAPYGRGQSSKLFTLERVAADGLTGAITTNADWSVSTYRAEFIGLVLNIPGFLTATATTLSGPTSADSGVASSNFSVACDGGITGTVIVTPSYTGGAVGGVFSPTTVSLSTGSPTGTFTFTPPATGGIYSVGTTNDGGLANPTPVALDVRVTAYPSSDVTVAGWNVTGPNGTTKSAGIGEAVASDTDYIQSPAITGSQGPVIFQLNKSVAAGGLTISVRARLTGTAAQVRALMTNDAGAVQGTSAWQSLTASFSDYTLSVTTTGVSTRIRIEVQ